MTEAVIDLRDRKNPPPDDPVNAPYGFRWDTKKREWVIKRSAGGRKSGSAWFGKREPEPEMAEFEADIATDKFRGAVYEDPEPAHMKSAPVKVPKVAPVRVTKKVKDDLAASCGMVGMIILPAVANKDPFCGEVLADNFVSITDALVPLLCRSSAVVNFFSSDNSDWILWWKLGMALSPVAMAVTKHHILKTVEIQKDEESGDLYVVPRDMTEYPT